VERLVVFLEDAAKGFIIRNAIDAIVQDDIVKHAREHSIKPMDLNVSKAKTERDYGRVEGTKEDRG